MRATRTQTRGEQSRREIVSVAIDCFSRHGYQGTSIDRIARAAGVTKGALYYHFEDKEALLFGALDDRIGGFERVVVERVTRSKDPIAALHAVADICVEQATRSNHRRFMLTLIVEALDTYPALSERFQQMMSRFRAFLADTVRIGQKKGVFRKDADPDLGAQLFVASLVGTEIQYYQDPSAVDLARSMHAATNELCEWLAARVPRRPKKGGAQPRSGEHRTGPMRQLKDRGLPGAPRSGAARNPTAIGGAQPRSGEHRTGPMRQHKKEPSP